MNGIELEVGFMRKVDVGVMGFQKMKVSACCMWQFYQADLNL